MQFYLFMWNGILHWLTSWFFFCILYDWLRYISHFGESILKYLTWNSINTINNKLYRDIQTTIKYLKIISENIYLINEWANNSRKH
jgi:hypothetical protein